MQWIVIFHPEFEPEFEELPIAVQDELYAEAGFVEMFGPETGRPHVDTLRGSRYPNMKELRFEAANGEWLLHLTRNAGRFFSSRVTRWVGARKSSIRD